MSQNSSIGKSVIIGLGQTGLSVAKYFAIRNIDFKVLDTRLTPPNLAEFQSIFPEIEIETGELRKESVLEAKELVVSPGLGINMSVLNEAKRKGIPITGDIDIFSKSVSSPILAVTGSNGKSTVVAILASILDKAGKSYGLGGNLDGKNFKPALDLLNEKVRELYVLELSSFQLETTKNLKAEASVILNLSSDHMDRYRNIEEYHQAKLRIFNGCRQVVVNRDDLYSYPQTKMDVPTWNFGFGNPGANGLGILEEGSDQYLAFQYKKIISVEELKIFGRHNISNVMAAIGLALSVNVDMKAIRSALKGFPGLPHRCQWVGDISGIDFYNDSKGTNVGATVAAIEGLGERVDGHIVLIAGGVAKGADFHALVPAINRWGKEVILIGQDALKIAKNFNQKISPQFAEDMDAAVRSALRAASPGDAVLLSPACASFDMFRDFQHRGETFINSVKEIGVKCGNL
ncbi:MAG: UDP-N-acetylmuramoyl-L-alanine--D-glutamate ligase [Gammaproteobacteria bacterium]|nr:UDP-N-acetylmuramoyl-L-alanine--D-glutamate ligase [Gammaproteobacteria bacterium]